LNILEKGHRYWLVSFFFDAEMGYCGKNNQKDRNKQSIMMTSLKSLTAF